MPNSKIVIKALIAITSALIAEHSQAEMYKCIDEETKSITFTDTACPERQQGAAIKTPEDYTANPPTEEPYKFPNSKPQYSTLDGSTGRCDRVGRDIYRLSETISILKEQYKTQDTYERVETKDRLENLGNEIYRLSRECPE